MQCSCLENPRDGGGWWAAVYGIAESDTTEATQQQYICRFSLVAQPVNNAPAMQETWL